MRVPTRVCQYPPPHTNGHPSSHIPKTPTNLICTQNPIHKVLRKTHRLASLPPPLQIKPHIKIKKLKLKKTHSQITKITASTHEPQILNI